MKVLALDIGGTKTALALVDTDSHLVKQLARISTPPPDKSGQAFLDELLLLAASHAHAAASIAVSICEIVTPKGDIASGHRVAWRGLPVRGSFSRIRPVAIDADVRCAARAEAVAGVGLGLESFLYVNMGTGTSASFVIGGRPWAGTNGAALVLANSPPRFLDGDRVAHEYALEDIAGGEGLAQEYLRMGGEPATARQILAAAEIGEEAALKILRRAAQAMGMALGYAADLLDPAAFVVGGGLSRSPIICA